jgi:hypothetical protein
MTPQKKMEIERLCMAAVDVIYHAAVDIFEIMNRIRGIIGTSTIPDSKTQDLADEVTISRRGKGVEKE